jgi:hypothetical protein
MYCTELYILTLIYNEIFFADLSIDDNIQLKNFIITSTSSANAIYLNKRNFQIENMIHSKVDKLISDNLDVHIHELEELQKLQMEHKTLVNVKGVIMSNQLFKYELKNVHSINDVE